MSGRMYANPHRFMQCMLVHGRHVLPYQARARFISSLFLLSLVVLGIDCPPHECKASTPQLCCNPPACMYLLFSLPGTSSLRFPLQLPKGCIMFFQVLTTRQLSQIFWLSPTQCFNILYICLTVANMIAVCLHTILFFVSPIGQKVPWWFSWFACYHISDASIPNTEFPIAICSGETNVQRKSLGAETVCAINC